MVILRGFAGCVGLIPSRPKHEQVSLFNPGAQRTGGMRYDDEKVPRVGYDFLDGIRPDERREGYRAASQGKNSGTSIN
jgi:hypothetical protein